MSCKTNAKHDNAGADLRARARRSSVARPSLTGVLMTKAVLGIIGGSGIYDLPGLAKARQKKVKSPWGEPSAPLRLGEIAGTEVVFLSRHDQGHRLSPSDINYRANIDVLKRAGVTDLVSLSACGSFKQELPPGTFVLVDQFIDRTYKRESSFFGKGCVAHVSMAHPVSLPPPPSKGSGSCAAAPMCAWRGRNSPRSPRASPTSNWAIR
jgi:purine nucleoside phosphorylase